MQCGNSTQKRMSPVYSLKISRPGYQFKFGQAFLGPVYMEDGLARLARQPGKRDEFLLCLYEKISSRLPGQFCYIDVVLTVVKNSLRRYL